MRQWFVAAILSGALSVSPLCFLFFCRLHFIRRLENQLLRRKYGDLPQYEAFVSGHNKPNRALPRIATR